MQYRRFSLLLPFLALLTGCGLSPTSVNLANSQSQEFDCSSVVFSQGFPNALVAGRQLFSATFETRVWDLQFRRELMSQSRLGGKSVAFSPDERSLLMGTWFGDLVVRDLEHNTEIRRQRMASASINSIVASPDGRLIAITNREQPVKLLNLESLVELGEIPVVCTGYHATSFSPDSQQLATVSGNVVQVWDLETRTQKKQFTCPDRAGSVAFTPRGTRVVVHGTKSSGESFVLVCNLLSGEVVDEGSIDQLIFSPDEQRFVRLSSRNATVQFMSVEPRQVLLMDSENQTNHYILHRETTGAFSPDGTSCIFGGKYLRRVDQNGKELLRFDPPSGERVDNAVRCVVFAPDGRHFAAAMTSGTVFVVDAITGAIDQTIPARCRTLQFSPTGRYLAITDIHRDNVGVVGEFEQSSGKVIRVLLPHPSPVNTMATSPDGRTLVTASADGILRTWNRATRLEVDRYQAEVYPDYVAAISPDGRLLVTGGKVATLWQMEPLKPIRSLPHKGSVYAVAISHSGSTIAVGGVSGEISLWDTNGNMKQFRNAEPWPIRSLAFSPDDDVLAAGGGTPLTGNTLLWCYQQNTELRCIGDSGAVTCLRFTPDGRYLLTAGIGRELRQWDVASAELHKRFTDLRVSVASLALNPDTGDVVVGGPNGLQTVPRMVSP